MKIADACEQAIEILRATNDGDDLAPRDLALVEAAVNSRLNEAGQAAFAALLESARKGYRAPWLHEVEHLTRDHAGYVYWRGIEIEHWSGDLPYSERGKIQAQELARRCIAIEARGDKVTCRAVIWDWPAETPAPAYD